MRRPILSPIWATTVTRRPLQATTKPTWAVSMAAARALVGRWCPTTPLRGALEVETLTRRAMKPAVALVAAAMVARARARARVTGHLVGWRPSQTSMSMATDPLGPLDPTDPATEWTVVWLVHPTGAP